MTPRTNPSQRIPARTSPSHRRRSWCRRYGADVDFCRRSSHGSIPATSKGSHGDRERRWRCTNPNWWTKPTGRWKPKPRKAKRGRVGQLSTSEIQRIRLLATLSHDEDEIGKQFGLSKRQVAQIAMGKVRPEAGGRIRSSRFHGVRFCHQQFEQELLSLRPDEPVAPHPPVDLGPQVARTPSVPTTGCPVPTGRPFPSKSYGQPMGRRIPRYAS